MNSPIAPGTVLESPSDSVALAGPKVLLFGESGTGKTYSLGSLADWCQANGKEMFVLFTENSTETLLGYWRDQGKEIPPCLHWHQAMTRPHSLKTLTNAAEKVGQLTYEAVTKLVDPDRSKNNAFYQILLACADFHDDRTGKKFGAIDTWQSDKVFVIDSLTELANAAMKMQVGSKPAAHEGDYGVAQHNLMNFLRLCTQGTPFTFVLTAHIDRVEDKISGATRIMVKAIGKAIAPEIPTMFSDVVFTVREATNFTWDTAAYGVNTKTRSLGYRSKIDPNFAQIMDLWKKRGGK